MFRYDEKEKKIVSEQFSMVVTDKVLLTFQEKKGDVFEPVRERIRKQKGRIRAAGIDYLAYALLDTIVDNYIFLIERIGEEISSLDQLEGTNITTCTLRAFGPNLIVWQAAISNRDNIDHRAAGQQGVYLRCRTSNWGVIINGARPGRI